MRIKKKIKGTEVIDLLRRLQEINLRGVKLTYNISRNKELLSSAYKHFEEAEKPDPKYLEFTKKADDIKFKHAKKDEDGKPITTKIPRKDQQPIVQVHIDGVDDPKSPFNIEIEALKKEYKDAIKQREDEGKEYEELLNKNFEFEFHPLNIDWFPDDVDQFAMDTLSIWLTDEAEK